MENVKLRDFYAAEYSGDMYAIEGIDEDVTFMDLFEALDCRRDVYECIGVCDSLVRERLFSKLAEIMGCDYDVVYYQWLGV